MKEYKLNIKPHIFTFYHILSKLFLFLIFPFLQQIFLNPNGIWQRINYTVLNILFISGVMVAIYFEYKGIKYLQLPNRISFTKGVFHKTITNLNNKNITCVSVSTNYVLWAVGCKKVNIYSNVNYNDTPIQLYTSSPNARQIMQYTFPLHNQRAICRQRIIAPAIMSFTKTNTLTTALAISAVTKRIGTVIGEHINSIIVESIKTIPQLLLTGIPPTLSYISGFIFAGFLIGAINQLLASVNFNCDICDRYIDIERGFIHKSQLRVSREKLKGVVIKQTLLMCICKIYTLSLVCVTDRKRTDTTYALLSFSNKLEEYTKYVIPLENYRCYISPSKTSLKSYLLMPIIWLLLVTTACVHLYNKFQIGFTARFMAIILLPIIIIWLWFRIVAFRHSKIYVGESTVKLHYYYHLNLYTAILYKNSITKTVITQNPIQRITKKCHLKLYIQNKEKMTIAIKHLSLDKVKDVMEYL